MSDYYTYRIRVTNEHKVQVTILDPDREELSQPSGSFGYKDALRLQIDQLHQAAIQGDLQNDQIKTLGEALFNALFDDVLRQDIVTRYNDIVHAQGKKLRVELNVDAQHLQTVAALPWEFMRVPEEANLGTLWLSTAQNVVFCRNFSQWFMPKPIQLEKQEKLRILLVVAGPDPDVYLPVWNSLQALETDNPQQFELLPLVTEATAPKLDEALQQHPHIFHFLGVGRTIQRGPQTIYEIRLYNESGNLQWLGADILYEALNQYRPAVVMLHASPDFAEETPRAFADIATKALEQSIPVIIATQYLLTHQLATQFATSFYERLARQIPVDIAAQECRRQLALASFYQKTDFASPLLYMRVRDGRLFDRKVTENETPEPVKQAQALREVLVQLNYNQQRGQLAALQYKPKMSTFLISGPNQLSGQRWLLNLLVKEDLKGEFIDGKSVRLDIAQKLTSQDVQRLWVALARGLNLPWTTSQEEIVDGMYEMWQERDLLIILDNVCHLGTAFPEIVLQQVWQPLVKRFQPRADSNWCLLFMLDNEGKLVAQGQNGDNIGDPARPVWLPPLKERFEADELGNWLGQWATQKALEKARQKLNPTSPDDFRAQLLALTDNGVPMFFVSELCSLCDHNWGTLKGQWLTL